MARKKKGTGIMDIDTGKERTEQELIDLAAGARTQEMELPPPSSESRASARKTLARAKVESPAEETSEGKESDSDALARLENVFLSGHKEAIMALREIRQRKLYRTILDGNGKPRYETFDDYVSDRWHHSRQWATQEIQWLDACEHLQKLTGDDKVFDLNKKDMAELERLLDDPEQMVLAYRRVKDQPAVGGQSTVSIVAEHKDYLDDEDKDKGTFFDWFAKPERIAKKTKDLKKAHAEKVENILKFVPKEGEQIVIDAPTWEYAEHGYTIRLHGIAVSVTVSVPVGVDPRQRLTEEFGDNIPVSRFFPGEFKMPANSFWQTNDKFAHHVSLEKTQNEKYAKSLGLIPAEDAAEAV